MHGGANALNSNIRNSGIGLESDALHRSPVKGVTPFDLQIRLYVDVPGWWKRWLCVVGWRGDWREFKQIGEGGIG